MSGQESEILRDQGSRTAEAAQASERAREERWAADREDRSSLRDSLEKDVSEAEDAPRKKTVEGFDGLDVRELATKMYEQAHVDAVQEERLQKQFKEFQTAKAVIKRTYGFDNPTDAIDNLLAAERLLRTNPAYALDYLRHQYGDGTYAQRVATTEWSNAISEVDKFFKEYEVSGPLEYGIIQALESNAVPRTGDFEADLKAAYRHAKKKMAHVNRI